MAYKWKPLKILFIGDEPSSKNKSPDVPFVGTPSYKRLLRWIGELDLVIEYVRIRNSNERTVIHEGEIVIFLGKKAAKKTTLIRFGEWENAVINKFKVIDHPSPRNRNFNDPKYEAKMLKDLKRWLYE